MPLVFALVLLLAGACSAAQELSNMQPKAVNLTFVGEITNKSDGTMYLGNGGKVYVNVPQGKFRIHPLVRVIDARNGKELASRDFKDVPCSSGFTMDVWAVIPNSGNVIAEGCKHVYVLDSTNLEVKRELSSSKDPKLWSSRFAVAPDGTTVALIEVFETKTATRSTTRLLRTTDWQDEGAWDGSGPSYYSADAKRLLVRNPPGIEVRKLPDGKPESVIEGGPREPLIAIDGTNAEEIRLIEHETGTVWNANLGNGRVKQGTRLENWPKIPHWRISASPDGSWLCAPTAQQLQENTPAFAIWSTRTGKILIKGESLVFSPQEKRDATHGIMGGYASCQVAQDGRFIMLLAGFGDRSTRARIYEVVQGE